MTAPRKDEAKAPRRHGMLALSLAGLVAAMVGLSFAAVPLYRMFCQATGYGGTPQRADKAPTRCSTAPSPSASTPMSIPLCLGASRRSSAPWR